MKRTLIVSTALLLGGFVFGSYLLENKVEGMRRHLAALDAEFLQEQRNIQVLKAEWSFLNQPERLQELALRHLDRVELRPIVPAQVGRLDELPARPEPSADGGAAPDGTPRPAFKPVPPAGVVFASTERRP
jgi:hypothetical protein